MEENPDLSGLEVTERPEGETVSGCEVSAVRKGTREDFYPETDEENLEYGSMNDELLQIEVEVTYDGKEIPVTEDMRYYDNPSSRSSLGEYIQRYGTPQKGQQVTVDFDSEGNASVVY